MARRLNFLITGAGRGIGRGLSRLLLERHHRVILVDNDEKELNNAVRRLGEAHGDDFVAIKCDLCQVENIQKIASTASDFFQGQLDCLINNAAFTGAVGAAPFKDLTLDDWNQSLQVNLTAPMLLSQACLPLMQKSVNRQTAGSIIMMSSTRARQSEANSEGYATTKAGLIGLTHSMAVSLAEQSIRVNAILPGWINVANECEEADNKRMTWEDGLSADDHRWHLTGRVGKVDDILKAVEYLVSADFATGTEIVVDGGVTRKMVYPE